MFATMIKDGFDLLTIARAGPVASMRGGSSGVAPNSTNAVDYLLHDQPVGFMKGKLRYDRSRACATTAIRRR